MNATCRPLLTISSSTLTPFWRTVASLHRQMFDAEELRVVLGVDLDRDVELKPVQVDAEAAPRNLGQKLAAEIVDVIVRGLFGVGALQMDMPDFKRHCGSSS